MDIQASPADAWEDIKLRYVTVFEIKKSHFIKLREKWAGQIDNDIVHVIDSILEELENIGIIPAIMDARSTSEPTFQNGTKTAKNFPDEYAKILNDNFNVMNRLIEASIYSKIISMKE